MSHNVHNAHNPSVAAHHAHEVGNIVEKAAAARDAYTRVCNEIKELEKLKARRGYLTLSETATLNSNREVIQRADAEDNGRFSGALLGLGGGILLAVATGGVVAPIAGMALLGRTVGELVGRYRKL